MHLLFSKARLARRPDSSWPVEDIYKTLAVTKLWFMKRVEFMMRVSLGFVLFFPQ